MLNTIKLLFNTQNNVDNDGIVQKNDYILQLQVL